MEEVINRLLEGNFEYGDGSLDFSCSKLELSIRPGQQAEGSFKILGMPGKYTTGRVSATDSRMECLTKEFVGSEEEIFFCFHGEELEEGDVVKGEFCVVSNQGEYYLSFVVNVEYTVLKSSLGNVKNLFHFANLAKTNPEEAIALFYNKDFGRICNGNDKQYYEYYKAMSAYPGNAGNVEEFLIGINKKQKIEYLTDVSEIRLEDPEGIVETLVSVTRNGWGYTRLQVETEGAFLYAEKSELSDDDFLGNLCRLPIYVDGNLLHDGNNFGSIRLINSYQEMEILVQVKKHPVRKYGRCGLERKRLLFQLMEYYQAFRMKKISTATWLTESRKLSEQLTAMNEQDIPVRLFQAQLLITEERYNEAQWILDHTADIMDEEGEVSAVNEAYYLYLTTLIQREESYIDEVTDAVEQLYKKNKREWRIAWLLLYLSEEYNRSFSKKWVFLEEQFRRGCYSPVVYIEAVQLLNMNPSLLMKLNRFEKQVLWYGVKNEMLHKDVILQFLYLVQKEREYSDSLYRILERVYRTDPDTMVLQEICSLLIKGNRSGREYFAWYAKGVEKELRITRLYDYYLMSADMDSSEALPKIVMMYFSYQCSLSYERAAFLYANVYKNKESFPELYENYRSTIEQFVLEQVKKRHINRNLAYLYKHLLVVHQPDEAVANALAEVLFVHLIQIQRADIRYVVVRSHGIDEEFYYPVTEGKAMIPLPRTDSVILFEDNSHNRYMASVSYTMEKLFLPGKFIKLISPLAGNVRDLNLYMCTNGPELLEIKPENEERFRYLLEDPVVNSKQKQAIGIKLVRYYYENDRIQELDAYLEELDLNEFAPKERGELLRYMVIHGKRDKAYESLALHGPYYAEPKTIVRLCSEVIKSRDFEENPVLTQAVMYAFRCGKGDANCLRYLVLYFNGLIREMRDIWKAASACGVETYELCERMILQMLFSMAFVGEKMDIFRSYVESGADRDLEKAFLSWCAYEYFVQERVTHAFLFEEIANLYRESEQLHRVCKLAFVKYYAENKQGITEDRKEIIKEFLRELLEEHIHLKMFTEFAEFTDFNLTQLLDRTIVEYKAHPLARAVMHYCVETSDGVNTEYLTEEMTEVIGGVCFKDFVLFFGERLQYYIMEERDGNEQLTESATIQKSDSANGSSESKFNLINDLSISNTLQDFETVDKLLVEYEYKEFMKNNLFQLL